MQWRTLRWTLDVVHVCFPVSGCCVSGAGEYIGSICAERHVRNAPELTNYEFCEDRI